jgi:hypothetical protein
MAKMSDVKCTTGNSVRRPAPDFNEAVVFGVFQLILPAVKYRAQVAVIELISEVIVDELPPVIPQRVVLLVNVAVRPIALVHVEFVDELRPTTKFTIAHRGSQLMACFKAMRFTNLVQ